MLLERRSAPAGGGCRLWRSVSKANGYGRVQLRLRAADGTPIHTHLQAHIVAWAIHHRRAPKEGHHIDHLCGNRACVAPAHLEEVPAVENIRRAPRREGARNPAAKLTSQAVLALRERFAADNTVTLRELAAEFGVTRPLVKAILVGDIWRVTGGPTLTREELRRRTLHARSLRKQHGREGLPVP
ncbi:HNH endonuclease signature motif containing protein [Vitiosangium sp. GDMCC 1.1324]|uniref:HNH endonuclease signature motif containing protein n=1 Tax=Vitiosangium sp. (strain GDMCC 1.1324) TaxID=2138576 RepID=UPI0035192529